MPLKPGKRNIGRNIREMERHGYPRREAVAASLSEAYGEKPAKKRKGEAEMRHKKPSEKREHHKHHMHEAHEHKRMMAERHREEKEHAKHHMKLAKENEKLRKELRKR